MTPSQTAQHNEGTCDLCTGWHDAEEAAFMNRRASQAAQEKPTSPRTEAGHCYDDDGWREKQLALNAGRGTWGGNDGTVRGVLEAWKLPLEGFLRSLCDWGYEIVERQAAAATPSLDPRRFGKAIRNTGTDWNIGDIGRVLNEYDALSASSEPSKAAAMPSLDVVDAVAQWLHRNAATRRRITCGLDSTGCRLSHRLDAQEILALARLDEGSADD